MSLLLNFIIYPKGTSFIPTWPLRPDLAYPCGRFGKGLNLPGNKASLITGPNNRSHEMENWTCDKDGRSCTVRGVRTYRRSMSLLYTFKYNVVSGAKDRERNINNFKHVDFYWISLWNIYNLQVVLWITF